jgi:hypothetical protein
MHEDFSRRVEIKLSKDRTFGLVFALFFALVGMFPILRGGTVRVWALGVSGIFLLAGVVLPSSLHPLNLAAAKLAEVLHRFVSPVVSGVFFFAILTPIAILARIFRKDSLHLSYDREAASYWVQRVKPGPEPSTMRNQF